MSAVRHLGDDRGARYLISRRDGVVSTRVQTCQKENDELTVAVKVAVKTVVKDDKEVVVVVVVYVVGYPKVAQEYVSLPIFFRSLTWFPITYLPTWSMYSEPQPSSQGTLWLLGRRSTG